MLYNGCHPLSVLCYCRRNLKYPKIAAFGRVKLKALFSHVIEGNAVIIRQLHTVGSVIPAKHGTWLTTVNPKLKFLSACLDKKCVVLGWGTFKGSHRSCTSKNYQTHEVELVDRKICGEYYGAYMITDRMICAKARNETTRNCLGDTGGKNM